MRILVVNDDGITAPGIRKLTELAKRVADEVIVSAPAVQQSAKAQSFTLHAPLKIKSHAFPVEGVEAYAVEGTPADCVKTAISHLLKDRRPDMVFSGINIGYNAGIDVLYSGTVGAAMEALVRHVPAVAFSMHPSMESYAIVDTFFDELFGHIRSHPALPNEIWNLNFPPLTPDEVRGIRYDVPPAQAEFYLQDTFRVDGDLQSGIELNAVHKETVSAEADTDIGCLMEGYITACRLKNFILSETY